MRRPPLWRGVQRAGPDRVTEQGELRARLIWALEKLNEVQREIVLLHDLEGWKHREIAEKLELPSAQCGLTFTTREGACGSASI